MNEPTKYWRQVNGAASGYKEAVYVREIQSWLMPVESLWPEPRDAKTDPPKGEGDAGRQVLGFGGDEWSIWHFARGGFTKWLPLPPVPVPEKSEAEIEYEKVKHAIFVDQKALFIAGFEAGKGEMKTNITIGGHMQLPAVGGRRLDRSQSDFERSCLVCLMREQEKLNPDNTIVAVLCDAVRLSREYCDTVKAAVKV